MLAACGIAAALLAIPEARAGRADRGRLTAPPPDSAAHGMGFIPPGVRIPALRRSIPARQEAALPSRFDWRENGVVTAVRDQSSCGSCWAFAALASVEAGLLAAGEPRYDFSENNLKECEWYESSCSGGNFFRAANFLSQRGTVLETCDPYVPAQVACRGTCPYVITLLGWKLIAGDYVPDPALIKSYIHEFGPVYTSFYAGWGDSWGAEMRHYDGSYTLYYGGQDQPNHAVLLVGWDDDLIHAGGKGAWIAKNSWGTDWGGTCGYGSQRGFFTMGYGSARMGNYTSFMSEWQEYDPDGRVLYYDEGGYSEDMEGYEGLTCWGLCAFEPDEHMRVERVEFWTTDATTDVDVYLYGRFDGDSLEDLLAASLDHSFEEPGYHSVKLAAPVLVQAGDDVYAAVRFTNSTFEAPVALDDQGVPETGRCFLSADGSSWQEVRTLPGHANSDVCIRIRGTEVEHSHTWSVPGDAGSLLEAVYLADAGDTILVAPGTYLEGSIVVPGSIVMLSEAGPESTVIDAAGCLSGALCAIKFENAGAAARLKGFSFTGIKGVPGVSAIQVVNASPTIEHCVIAGMSSSAGACVNVSGGAPRIRNCTFHGNTAAAAVYFGPWSGGILENCIISATAGGQAVSCAPTAAPVTSCCDIYGNSGGDGVCGGDGGGNFCEDPLFCNAGDGDLRLQDSSPCLAPAGCGLVGALGQGCPTQVPAALAAFNAAGEDDAVLLSWTLPGPPVQGAYIVYCAAGHRGTPQNGDPVENGNSGRFPGGPSGDFSFLHTGLENGVTYNYTAFAYNGDLMSDGGLEAAATPLDKGPPGPPVEVGADPAPGSITLGWTYPDDGDLEGVVVRYSTASYPGAPAEGNPVENGAGGIFTGTPGRDTSFVHTGLADEVTYYYSLFAYDEVPCYSAPACVSASPGDVIPPGPVSGFSLSAADSAVRIEWTNPADADFEGTLIRYSTAQAPSGPDEGSPVENGAGGVFPGDASAVCSFDHTGLANGMVYYYSAFAFDHRLNYSAPVSGEAVPADLVPPAAISSFSAAAGDTSVSLRWTNPGDMDYRHTLIRYSTAALPASPGEGVPVENGNGGIFEGVRAAADSFVHAGLPNGVTHYYAAFASDEERNYSGAAHTSAVPRDTLPPPPAVQLAAGPRDGSVMLRWTNPEAPDFAGVAVRYSISACPGAPFEGEPVENGNGGLFPGSPAAADSFLHAGLDNETRYFYSVFSYDEVPNHSARDTVSALPFDQTPPVLLITVFQNPYITNHLDLIVIASEALQDTSVGGEVGETPLRLEIMDETEHVWRGDFDLCSTGVLGIGVCGRDLRGNRATAERSFSSSVVGAASGGPVSSPDGRFTARMPAGALDRDSYVLVLEREAGSKAGLEPHDGSHEGPEPAKQGPEPGANEGPEPGWEIIPGSEPVWGDAHRAYTISPGPRLTGKRFEIRIEYEPGEPDPGHLAIAAVEEGQAVPLECYLLREESAVAAMVSKPGPYTLVRRPGTLTPDCGSGGLRVCQNAPNPFIGVTLITFDLPHAARVRAGVFSVDGRLIRTLADDWFAAGRHDLSWDGLESGGTPAASGLYLYRVTTPAAEVTRKMVLLR